MRWLGLLTNKTFRKYRKLIFPHWDFIICLVSLAIVHPHFSIRILSSAFFHPHFIIRNFPSAFFHPHFSIRHPPPATIRSALYRDPFCFPETLNVSRLKTRKKLSRSCLLLHWAHKFAAVSRSTTWSRVSQKFMLLFT